MGALLDLRHCKLFSNLSAIVKQLVNLIKLFTKRQIHHKVLQSSDFTSQAKGALIRSSYNEGLIPDFIYYHPGCS